MGVDPRKRETWQLDRELGQENFNSFNKLDASTISCKNRDEAQGPRQ